MKYQTYELAHSLMRPWRAQSKWLMRACSNPFNPLGRTELVRKVAASCEVFESLTRRYGKPAWGLTETMVVGQPVPVREEIVKRTPSAICSISIATSGWSASATTPRC